MASLQPATGTLGTARAKHLLRRLRFGFRKAELSTFSALTPQAALNLLFDGFSAPVSPVTPDGIDILTFEPETPQDNFRMGDFWQNWWLGRMYKEDTSLEKLTFFLHTVITNKSDVVEDYKAYYYQIALFRQYLINDFTNTNPRFNRYTQLIKKMCVDNAMLQFLDGRVNVKGRPNENFARELFELFTLGKGNSVGPGNYTNYTEADIIAAAKVFTGWINTTEYLTNLDPDTGLPTGKVKGQITNVNQHDNTIKTFSSAFVTPDFPTPEVRPNPLLLNGNNPTLESCTDEISQLIDIVFAKPEAEEYLMRKVYRFFVHWNISSEIETDIIKPLAVDFKNNGFRLRPVLERLFTSEHFYEAGAGVDDDKFGGIIKSPLDLIFGTLKYFNFDIGADNSTLFYENTGYIKDQLPGMQLNFLNPYDVAGYEPYHQAPSYNRNWITSTSIANRYDFINSLFMPNNKIYMDLLAWADNALSGITDAIATTPTDVNGELLAMDFVKYIASEVLPYANVGTEITQERYNYFALYHLGGLTFNNWVISWNGRNSGNAMLMDDARARINNLYNVIMQSPEYQLF